MNVKNWRMQVPAAILAGTAGLSLAVLAHAQQAGMGSPFQGGVPHGSSTSEELSLTLDDAISRGLVSNLASIASETSVESAAGALTVARADLLPRLRGSVTAERLKISLAASGFKLPGFPTLVGPFNVVDARAYIRQAILDLAAVERTRSAARSLAAARYDERNARDVVVLVCGQLYLQGVADESRIAAARAQLDTAQSLLSLARDRKAAGLVAGIEVLRANVQEQTQEQRLIVAQEEAAKDKLALARAIGLPLGQRFRLADAMPFTTGEPMTVAEATERAWQQRPDLKAAEARVAAAQAAHRAAVAENLPSLGVSADVGEIGNTAPGARATYSLAAQLAVPLFEGGRAAGHRREAAARLRLEQARLADMRAQVAYEVQSVFLDIEAADARVRVAESTRTLATEQLQQARDRFASGVADTLEVVQAQETLATAEENRIASLYAHNVARLSLARALGGTATSYEAFLKER